MSEDLRYIEDLFPDHTKRSQAFRKTLDGFVEASGVDPNDLIMLHADLWETDEGMAQLVRDDLISTKPQMSTTELEAYFGLTPGTLARLEKPDLADWLVDDLLNRGEEADRLSAQMSVVTIFFGIDRVRVQDPRYLSDFLKRYLAKLKKGIKEFDGKVVEIENTEGGREFYERELPNEQELYERFEAGENWLHVMFQ